MGFEHNINSILESLQLANLWTVDRHAESYRCRLTRLRVPRASNAGTLPAPVSALGITNATRP